MLASLSSLFIYSVRGGSWSERREGFVGWLIRAGAEKGACKNPKVKAVPGCGIRNKSVSREEQESDENEKKSLDFP